MRLFKNKSDKLKPSWEFNGHKFYVLNPYIADETSPLKLSNTRALEFALALINVDLCMKRSSLESLINKISELAMEKRCTEIVTICGITKERLKLKSNADLFIELGLPTVLIDDEPNEKPTIKHNQLKQDLLKYDDVRAFFLRRGIQWLNNIDPSFNSTLTEDYLQGPEAKEIEAIFQSWI